MQTIEFIGVANAVHASDGGAGRRDMHVGLDRRRLLKAVAASGPAATASTASAAAPAAVRTGAKFVVADAGAAGLATASPAGSTAPRSFSSTPSKVSRATAPFTTTLPVR